VTELRRGLARAVTAFVAVVGACTTAVGLASPTDSALPGVAAGLLLLASASAVARVRPVLALTLALGASTIAEFASDPTNGLAPGGATYAVLAIGLIALTQFTAPYATAATAAGIVVYVCSGLPDGEAVLYRVDMQALTIGSAAAGIGFIALLFASAAATDEEGERTRVERVHRAAAEAQAKALADTQRLIHDDVVGALAVIGSGRLDPSEARSRARQALERLTAVGVSRADLDREVTWSEVASMVVEDIPVSVAIDLPETGPRLELHQAMALVDASREALRNVGRHAGVTSARWGVHREPGHVVVTIADQGRGMAGAPWGMGLRQSVVARVADVGGRAEIRSDPHGTTVTLTVPVAPARSGVQRDLAGAYFTTLRTTGTSRARVLALRVAIPMLVANTWVGLRHGLVDAATLWEAPLWLATIVATIGFAWSLGRREPHPFVYAAIVVGVAVDTGLGLRVAGDGATADFRSWMILGNVIVLILLAYVTPLRWAPLYTLPNLAVVVIVSATDPSVALLATAGALISPLVPLPAGILGHMQRRANRRLEAEHTRLMDAQVGRETAARIRDVERRELSTTMREALPFLEELAVGTHVDDLTLRRRAGRIAGAVRDDLYAPGVIDAPLRAHAADLRGRGGNLVIRPDVDVSHVRNDFRALLTVLLPSVSPETTVTISQDGAGAVRVVVVPPISLELPPGHGAAVTHRLHRSEFVLGCPHLSGDGTRNSNQIGNLP